MTTTKETFIPVEPTAPSPVRTRRMLTLGAAAIVTVAALGAGFQNSGHGTAQPAARAVSMTMDQKLQVLVDRGLIPRQALQPAPRTMEQKLQDLVDRGLIPRQALQPAPRTMEQKLQDLVDRGLIPPQSLEQAPVSIIFGPAHPLGAPDSGIACSELVYTRC